MADESPPTGRVRELARKYERGADDDGAAAVPVAARRGGAVLVDDGRVRRLARQFDVAAGHTAAGGAAGSGADSGDEGAEAARRAASDTAGGGGVRVDRLAAPDNEDPPRQALPAEAVGAGSVWAWVVSSAAILVPSVVLSWALAPRRSSMPQRRYFGD